MQDSTLNLKDVRHCLKKSIYKLYNSWSGFIINMHVKILVLPKNTVNSWRSFFFWKGVSFVSTKPNTAPIFFPRNRKESNTGTK